MKAPEPITGGRPRRGRRRGPKRAQVTVRLLEELNDKVTVVCEETEAGLQDVLDAAVANFLVEHGWMEPGDVPPAAAAAMEKLRRSKGDDA